ncbi:hypothetical protein R6Q59_029403 [Mikania micrantha]
MHCSRSLIASNQRAILIDDTTCSAHPIDFQSGDYGRGTILTFPFNDVKIYSHLDGLLCVCLNQTSELLLWNPVTQAYKLLSTPDRNGFFEYDDDAVGLYIDAEDNYKVLHVKRRNGVFIVSVYSRRLASWRNIPFITRPEFVSPSFSFSSGTLCGDTLYFTVCDCWIGGENVLIGFEVNSEQFKEISFPPFASGGMSFGDLMNIKNQLYIFVSTGIEDMWVELWMLEDDYWIKSLSFPPIAPIPLGLCESTSAEKRKENNARYYASRKENTSPQYRNVLSTSSVPTLREKRKEWNARYYASRKENNKVAKVDIEFSSQSTPFISKTANRSTEMIPLRTLQTNGGQINQFTSEDVSCTQNSTNNSTPTCTLPYTIDEVMHEIS